MGGKRRGKQRYRRAGLVAMPLIAVAVLVGLIYWLASTISAVQLSGCETLSVWLGGRAGLLGRFVLVLSAAGGLCGASILASRDRIEPLLVLVFLSGMGVVLLAHHATFLPHASLLPGDRIVLGPDLILGERKIPPTLSDASDIDRLSREIAQERRRLASWGQAWRRSEPISIEQADGSFATYRPWDRRLWSPGPGPDAHEASRIAACSASWRELRRAQDTAYRDGLLVLRGDLTDPWLRAGYGLTEDPARHEVDLFDPYSAASR